jgi:L-tartrate/succinate antiporter
MTARRTGQSVATGTALRAAVPIALAAVLALLPPPAGLAPHAWLYFAIFAGVVAALVLEPLPAPAIGLIAVAIVATLARWVLLAPDELARPGIDATALAVRWALGGFANTTVWLAFGAFMFALGYERTGLGRRIALLLVRAMGHRTLLLGYAVTCVELVLAPFTPSNTARSAGAVFPILRNLPPLYGSMPGEPSARRIGGYMMWTAFAASCVTSSLFLTACAPNLLALEFLRRGAHVEITWMGWFAAAAPFALPLLIALPALAFLFYPPQIRRGGEAPRWAAAELAGMGPPSRAEITLALLVVAAMAAWIFAGRYVDATTVALLAIALLLATRIVSWQDMAGYASAWTTLTMLATLVTLSDGLVRVGFIGWFADWVGPQIAALSPRMAAMALVAVYFLSHYLFASLTAHTVVMMPAMIAIALRLPGIDVAQLGLLLATATGLMGVITPYATGPAPAYHGSGYIPGADFWRLGTIFGAIFLAALLAAAATLPV